MQTVAAAGLGGEHAALLKDAIILLYMIYYILHHAIL